MAARNGKIAHLPETIREELNQRLLDGQTGRKILPWLNGLAVVKAEVKPNDEGVFITDDNLSNWRTGGYQDWLKRRERVTRIRELSSYAVKLVGGGTNISDGAAQIASGQVLEVLEQMEELGQPK